MLKRERYIEDIKEQMAIFQYKIELETNLNHHNLKLYGENFFRDILNIVYPKADFTNTNFLKSNYSAIDLICHKTEKCIQITSNRTRDKIKDTINAYKKSQYSDYAIEIYYLLEKAKPNNIKDLEKELKIENLSSKLKDSRDLMKNIDNLEVEELEQVWRLFKINGESIHFLPKLKEKYLNDFSTISLLINDTPKPIEDIFINLAIIKEQKENKQDKNLISREALLNSYEEIHKPKEPIEIEELINISNKSLIYGKAGVGKTTLCKYIAYKWSKSELYSEFEYVVYLPLREWKIGGILQAIKNYYFPLDSDGLSFELKGANALFLFDGYDELSGERKKDLRDEIEKYGLSNYIITTRPYGYQRNDFRVDEHFETIGFVDEDVEAYIDNFFEESEPKKRLKAFLDSNIGIKHIAYIPLMLEMICSLWQERPFNDSLTMTELYSAVVESILKKHSAKKEDEAVYKRANRKKINNILGKLAFRGLTKQTILFDGDFIEEVIDDEDIDFFEKSVINSGFLKSDRQEKDILDNSFEFLHLTFQEYFSALYASNLSPKKQRKIIQKCKFYPHMQMFFAFLGGLIEDKEFLLGEIESEPRDLVGFYEFNLILICISEMNEVLESRKNSLFKQFKFWLLFIIENELDNKIILNKLKLFSSFVKDCFLHDLLKIIKNKKVDKYIRIKISDQMIPLALNFNEFILSLLSIIKDDKEEVNTRGIIASSISQNKNAISSIDSSSIDTLWKEFGTKKDFNLFDSYDKEFEKFMKLSMVRNKVEDSVFMGKPTIYDLIEYDNKIENTENLFLKYNKNNAFLIIIMQNSFYNLKLLYLKNNKLHTIENGKEISTQREVDEVTLNEIKMLLKGDNLND